MQPWELYNEIWNTDYKKSGLDVDWTIKVDTLEREIRLLFAPSNSSMDWKNNFKFPAKLYKNQENKFYVAVGWGNCYKSCNDEIMDELINAIKKNPQFKVTIAGHSYGGAMSVLAAEDLHYRLSIKPDVVTFGAPKPLYGKVTKEYFLSCCHTVNQYAHVNDIVPKMPPFPLYENMNVVKIGKKCSIFNFFKTNWHLIYGDKSVYKGV